MVLEETAQLHELDILAQRYQTTLAMPASEEKATEAEYAASLARYGASKRQSGEGVRWVSDASAARCRAVQCTLGWGWTGGSGWGRVAPQRCPGGAAGGTTWEG